MTVTSVMVKIEDLHQCDDEDLPGLSHVAPGGDRWLHLGVKSVARSENVVSLRQAIKVENM